MSSQFAYDDHLGHSIKRIYQVMDRTFNAILRPYGVARSQWYILYELNKSSPLTQKQLQSSMQVESATLTATLNSLVRKGWIMQKTNNADRRAKVLQLTPLGQQLWEKLPDPVSLLRKQLLEGITETEEQMARQVLNKAIKNLERGE